VQDWLPEDHLARYVVDVAERLGLSKIEQSDTIRSFRKRFPL
jgi:hypothetical protein